MIYFYWIAGTILAVIWIWRLLDCAIGMRSVADLSHQEWDRPAAVRAPRVSVIVPARNEEACLEQALTSLLQLDYPQYEIIAVNDRSTDRTGEIMERVANLAENTPGSRGRLRVMHIDKLPEGWLGKTHAMWTASERTSGEWLLFTDADVIFRADSLRRVMAYANDTGADHIVLFPTMVMKSSGERMMNAFFFTLFVFGPRPWKVADPNARDHIGVGAFNLIRRSAYEGIGSYRALRLEVIDDMKLGKAVKEHHFAQRSAFGPGLLCLRWAQGAMGVVHNLTKNFFALMLFQWPRTLASCLVLLFLNLGPFLGIIFAPGWATAGYAGAFLAIAALYVGISRKIEISPAYVLLHPVSTLLLVYTILRSMFVTLWHGGVVWRGTIYPLKELRKGTTYSGF